MSIWTAHYCRNWFHRSTNRFGCIADNRKALWNKALPTGKKLLAIHKIFGVSIDWLLTGKPTLTDPQSAESETVLLEQSKERIDDLKRHIASLEKTVDAQQDLIEVYKEKLGI